MLFSILTSNEVKPPIEIVNSTLPFTGVLVSPLIVTDFTQSSVFTEPPLPPLPPLPPEIVPKSTNPVVEFGL